jgi:hypothetical protein
VFPELILKNLDSGVCALVNVNLFAPLWVLSIHQSPKDFLCHHTLAQCKAVTHSF